MGPGGFDMQQIFAAAQQALTAQQELANSELVGTAGNGAVRAVVSGVGQLLDVTIDPSVIDPTDPAETASTIADLVLAAVRDAWDSAIDLQQQQLGALGGGGLGGGLGGSLSGLSGALGGGGGIDLSALGLPGLGAPIAFDEDDEYDEDDEDDDDDDEEDFDDEDDEDPQLGGEVGPEGKED